MLCFSPENLVLSIVGEKKAYDYIKEMILRASHLLCRKVRHHHHCSSQGKTEGLKKKNWKISAILRYNRNLMARANYFSKDWKSRKLRLHRPVWSRGLPRTNRDAWDRVPHVVQSLSRCKDKIPIVHLPEKGGKTTISQYNSFLFSFTGPALKGDYFTRTQLTQERGKPESLYFLSTGTASINSSINFSWGGGQAAGQNSSPPKVSTHLLALPHTTAKSVRLLCNDSGLQIVASNSM